MSCDNNDSNDKKAKKRHGIIFILLIIVFASIFTVSAVCLIYNVKDYPTARIRNNKLKKLLNEPVTSEEAAQLPEEAKPDFAKLYATNNDFIGWVKIYNTVIDYPVCLSHDNEEYLKTDFYGKHHRLGCVFADYRSTITAQKQSENVILYGHSAADGSYFNAIRKYKSMDFYGKHKIISFDTLYEKSDWVIIGAFIALPHRTSTESFEYFNCIDMDENAFNEYLTEVADRSYFDTDIDVAYGDKLITLSTCDYEYDNTRFVVVARKLRDTETKDSFNDIQISYNSDRYVPDFDSVKMD